MAAASPFEMRGSRTISTQILRENQLLKKDSG